MVEMSVRLSIVPPRQMPPNGHPLLPNPGRLRGPRKRCADSFPFDCQIQDRVARKIFNSYARLWGGLSICLRQMYLFLIFLLILNSWNFDFVLFTKIHACIEQFCKELFYSWMEVSTAPKKCFFPKYSRSLGR